MVGLDYIDRLAYDQLYDDFISEKMEKQRQEKINFFKTIVRQDLAEDFTKILAAAYEYGSPEAENISAMFGFNQSDFLAKEEKLKEYKKNYEENQSWEPTYE